MLGFGRSGIPGPGFPWSLEGLTADALEVARAAGAERFHFVGESVGGTVGLAARKPASRRAAEPDRVERLASGRLDPAGAGVAGVHPRQRHGEVGRDDDAAPSRPRPGLARAKYRWFERAQARCSADSVLDLADVLIGSDLSPELGRIPVPTLLLAPGRSPFVPLAVMEEMHAGIAGSELPDLPGRASRPAVLARRRVRPGTPRLPRPPRRVARCPSPRPSRRRRTRCSPRCSGRSTAWSGRSATSSRRARSSWPIAWRRTPRFWPRRWARSRRPRGPRACACSASGSPRSPARPSS